jgi:Alginate export
VHVLKTGAGPLDLLAWGAVQTGPWGALGQRAAAYDVEAGFQPQVLPALKPWLRAGHFWSSGDADPNDNLHQSFFQILPTPRPYARFPFFYMMNNQDTFAMLSLRPHAKVTVSNEFHSLRLSSAKDLWYSGGGAFQPWTFGYTGRSTSGMRPLGNMYDSSVEFRMNRKLTFTGYFGYAQGLSVMKQIYPNGKDGKFGYVEALIRL